MWHNYGSSPPPQIFFPASCNASGLVSLVPIGHTFIDKSWGIWPGCQNRNHATPSSMFYASSTCHAQAWKSHNTPSTALWLAVTVLFRAVGQFVFLGVYLVGGLEQGWENPVWGLDSSQVFHHTGRQAFHLDCTSLGESRSYLVRQKTWLGSQ